MSERGLGQPSFSLIVDQIAASAIVQLGLVPNPVTGKTEVSRERAQFTLAQLELLQEKTAGNLTAAEDAHLERRIADIASRLGTL